MTYYLRKYLEMSKTAGRHITPHHQHSLFGKEGIAVKMNHESEEREWRRGYQKHGKNLWLILLHNTHIYRDRQKCVAVC